MPELRLEIDPLKLADEWLDQPSQRRIWGEQLADAQLELDEAKSNLSVAQAEADREIREHPGDHGLVKVTEASISTAVTVDPFVRKAVERANKARHRVNVLQAAVDGLEHRKRALSMLCELHSHEYFATPTMPPGIRSRNKYRETEQD